MQIQHNARAPLILRREPCALKAAEIMLADIDLPLVNRRHQLAQLVLPLAGDLQRAIGDERLEKIQLGANQFCVQLHEKTFLSAVRRFSGVESIL